MKMREPPGHYPCLGGSLLNVSDCQRVTLRKNVLATFPAVPARCINTRFDVLSGTDALPTELRGRDKGF